MSKKSQPETEFKRSWLEPKDYVTVTLSSLAIIVSVLTAYFNILRTAESVSLISDNEQLAMILDENTLVIPSDIDGQIALINSGTRAVVISSVVVFYLQPVKMTAPECLINGVNIRTDFESTVLKPNDVLVKKMKLEKAAVFVQGDVEAKRNADGNFTFPIADHNKGKKDIIMDVCLEIAMSTPSTVFHVARVPVFRFHAQPNGWMYDPYSEGPIQQSPPVLISRTGTIFSF